MKFVSQIIQKCNTFSSDPESQDFAPFDQKNLNTEIQNIKFTPEIPSKIHQHEMQIILPQISQKQPKIEDLIHQISKLTKTQINSSSKLFIELGLQLSFKPDQIYKIGDEKNFLRNFIEFTRNVRQMGESKDENQKKVYKIWLNTLLYILMLLVCMEKENCKTIAVRQKLFGSKAFLKHFLGISIFKHPKFAKLYGIIIIHIYKQKLSLEIKKCLVESIIRNLKQIEHEKTELNLCMILDELKFSYKLKQNLVREQQLVDKVWEILRKNTQKYQFVYPMNYFLYLVHEFPGHSNVPFTEISNALEITENIKNFILTSKFFQRSFQRFFQWSVHQLTPTQAFNLGNKWFLEMEWVNRNKNSGEKETKDNQKWFDFLLKWIQIFVKSVPNEESVLYMVEKGLLSALTNLLQDKILDEMDKNKIYQLLEECLNRVKTVSKSMYQALLSFLTAQMIETSDLKENDWPGRIEILAGLKSKSQAESLCPMELE